MVLCIFNLFLIYLLINLMHVLPSPLSRFLRLHHEMSSSDAILTQILAQLGALQVSQQSIQAQARHRLHSEPN